MKRWMVWIQQINRDMIEVDAETEEEAIRQARLRWRQETYPEVTDIVEVKKVEE